MAALIRSSRILRAIFPRRLILLSRRISPTNRFRYGHRVTSSCNFSGLFTRTARYYSTPWYSDVHNSSGIVVQPAVGLRLAQPRLLRFPVKKYGTKGSTPKDTSCSAKDTTKAATPDKPKHQSGEKCLKFVPKTVASQAVKATALTETPKVADIQQKPAMEAASPSKQEAVCATAAPKDQIAGTCVKFAPQAVNSEVSAQTECSKSCATQNIEETACCAKEQVADSCTKCEPAEEIACCSSSAAKEQLADSCSKCEAEKEELVCSSTCAPEEQLADSCAKCEAEAEIACTPKEQIAVSCCTIKENELSECQTKDLPEEKLQSAHVACQSLATEKESTQQVAGKCPYFDPRNTFLQKTITSEPVAVKVSELTKMKPKSTRCPIPMGTLAEKCVPKAMSPSKRKCSPRPPCPPMPTCPPEPTCSSIPKRSTKPACPPKPNPTSFTSGLMPKYSPTTVSWSEKVLYQKKELELKNVVPTKAQIAEGVLNTNATKVQKIQCANKNQSPIIMAEKVEKKSEIKTSDTIKITSQSPPTPNDSLNTPPLVNERTEAVINILTGTLSTEKRKPSARVAVSKPISEAVNKTVVLSSHPSVPLCTEKCTAKPTLNSTTDSLEPKPVVQASSSTPPLSAEKTDAVQVSIPKKVSSESMVQSSNVSIPLNTEKITPVAVPVPTNDSSMSKSTKESTNKSSAPLAVEKITSVPAPNSTITPSAPTADVQPTTPVNAVKSPENTMTAPNTTPPPVPLENLSKPVATEYLALEPTASLTTPVSEPIKELHSEKPSTAVGAEKLDTLIVSSTATDSSVTEPVVDSKNKLPVDVVIEKKQSLQIVDQKIEKQSGNKTVTNENVLSETDMPKATHKPHRIITQARKSAQNQYKVYTSQKATTTRDLVKLKSKKSTKSTMTRGAKTQSTRSTTNTSPVPKIPRPVNSKGSSSTLESKSNRFEKPTTLKWTFKWPWSVLPRSPDDKFPSHTTKTVTLPKNKQIAKTASKSTEIPKKLTPVAPKINTDGNPTDAYKKTVKNIENKKISNMDEQLNKTVAPKPGTKIEVGLKSSNTTKSSNLNSAQPAVSANVKTAKKSVESPIISTSITPSANVKTTKKSVDTSITSSSTPVSANVNTSKKSVESSIKNNLTLTSVNEKTPKKSVENPIVNTSTSASPNVKTPKKTVETPVINSSTATSANVNTSKKSVESPIKNNLTSASLNVKTPNKSVEAPSVNTLIPKSAIVKTAKKSMETPTAGSSDMKTPKKYMETSITNSSLSSSANVKTPKKSMETPIINDLQSPLSIKVKKSSKFAEVPRTSSQSTSTLHLNQIASVLNQVRTDSNEKPFKVTIKRKRRVNYMNSSNEIPITKRRRLTKSENILTTPMNGSLSATHKTTKVREPTNAEKQMISNKNRNVKIRIPTLNKTVPADEVSSTVTNSIALKIKQIPTTVTPETTDNLKRKSSTKSKLKQKSNVDKESAWPFKPTKPTIKSMSKAKIAAKKPLTTSIAVKNKKAVIPQKNVKSIKSPAKKVDVVLPTLPKDQNKVDAEKEQKLIFKSPLQKVIETHEDKNKKPLATESTRNLYWSQFSIKRILNSISKSDTSKSESATQAKTSDKSNRKKKTDTKKK